MEETHAQTIEENRSGSPPGSSSSVDTTHEPPSIGVNSTVALQPGETLIIYHPHSQCPMRIVPTAELHSPSERAVRHDIKTSEASHAPFPTRADFEQAEIFVNNNCSNKFIDAQLKFECRNGMRLTMKTSRKMHELLARGAEDDSTDDSKVSSNRSVAGLSIAHRIPLSFVTRRSKFHTSKASSKRTERTQFATVPRWTRCFV